MKVVITVDTEADHQKNGDDPVRVTNLKELPWFQELCEDFDLKPTYFVTYEAITDKETVSYLKTWHERGVAEVGAHLHPWTTPPYSGVSKGLPRPSELTNEVLSNKLKKLTETIKENIGSPPTSYRAGRWGLDERQVGLLSQLGYIVDSSVTSKVSWKKEGGPDFRCAKVIPYKISSSSVLEEDTSGVITEVPMTILFSGIVNKEQGFLGRFFVSLEESFMKKVLNRLFFRQKWFRVFPNSTLSDWRRLYKSAIKNNVPVLVFMIHSSELALGTSPLTRTKHDWDRMRKGLSNLFSFLKEKEMESVTLSEFARAF